MKIGKILIHPLFAENDLEAGGIILEVSTQIPHHQPSASPARAQQSHPCEKYNLIIGNLTNHERERTINYLDDWEMLDRISSK